MTYKKFIELVKKSEFVSGVKIKSYGEKYKIEYDDKVIVIGQDKEGDIVLNLSNVSMKNCPFTYTTNKNTGVSKVVIPMIEIRDKESALVAIKWMMSTMEKNESVKKGGIFTKILSFFKGLF